jgi:DNA polymerase elongation subunit (family B)
MKLLNISNHGRKVYLFCRNDKGELEIKEDNSFHPYYYEPNSQGTFISYDGKKLKKVFCTNPSDVSKLRSSESYESDVLFKRRYMIDKINELTKTKIKYLFIDIEILSPELPNVKKAEYPVSCISVYNSISKSIKTFYLGDYKTEYDLIEDFIKYMQKEKADLFLSWNVQFDYNYLYNRFPDFAKRISPIGEERYGDREVFYPAGISIVDYLQWFRKIFLREFSYGLDYIAQKHLKRGKKYKNPCFNKLNEEIKLRNIDDVQIMVDLEKKYEIISYFDEMRRFSKVEWEDLIFNSRIIESLLFEEAKEKNIILPNKKRNVEKTDYQGATRDVTKLGTSFNIGKYDLAGAYPQAIIDFCLDSSNITEDEGIKIEGNYYKQNSEALLPSVVRKLLTKKNEVKKLKNSISVDSPDYKDISKKYDCIKSITNSSYGVFGNRYFRLYDKKIASATTFLVRNLLLYVKDTVEKMGIPVIYFDTDSVFLDTKDNIVDILNDLIKQWGKERFNKDNVTIEFDYEGIFEKILIVALCRYKGYLRKSNGELKSETKGLESKRNDSSKYMKKFQDELLDKLMKKETQENITNWIKSEIERIKTLPLKEVAFPVKLQKRKYVNVPIFLRASNNAEKYGFKSKLGEHFYYIYIIPKEFDENGKEINVMAFKDNIDYIEDIDWNEMVRRNILTKIQTIYDVMDWKLDIILDNTPRLKKPKIVKLSRKKVIVDKEPNQIKLW